jgi:hypothetical protein
MLDYEEADPTATVLPAKLAGSKKGRAAGGKSNEEDMAIW